MVTAPIHHRIKIEHKGDNAIPPNPMPVLNIGDTVQYYSTAGTVSIEFVENGSPFKDTKIGGDPATVVNSGTFRCRCFIKLKSDGKTVGWKSDPSPSGADHDVPKKFA
jgi:hypothetical protein